MITAALGAQRLVRLRHAFKIIVERKSHEANAGTPSTEPWQRERPMENMRFPQ